MSEGQADRAHWIRSALSTYEAPLMRYASTLLRDVEGARDVVQDTFLRLCEADPRRVDGHLAAWLFTVCRNRAFDVLRKNGRIEGVDSTRLDSQLSADLGPAGSFERRETLNRVLTIVATLGTAEQEVIRLRFQGDLSYQEISQVTGRSVTHVGVLIHSAVKTIRSQILSVGSGPRAQRGNK